MTEKEKRDAELQALDDEVYSEVLGLRLTPWGPMKFTPALLFMPAMSARTCRSYSTDIAAAWDMEEEIQRRGLGIDYTKCLLRLLYPEGAERYGNDEERLEFHQFYRVGPRIQFALLRASPELRCRAALFAVRGEMPTPPTE